MGVRFETLEDGTEMLVISIANPPYEVREQIEDYPGQAYFWKHNVNIKNAELAWRRRQEENERNAQR